MKDKLRKLGRLLRHPEKIAAYSRWLWAKTKPFFPSLLLVAGIDLLSILIGFGGSFVSKNVVDTATAGQSFGPAFLLMIVLTALPIIVSAATGVFSTLLHERLAFSVRSKVFDTMLSARYLGLSAYHSGDLLTRLTRDADAVASCIASVLPSLVMILVRLTAAFALLYGFSPFLAVSALLLAPAGLVIALVSGEKMKALSVEVRESEAAYRCFLQEHTANIAVVKAFCIEENSRHKLGELRQRSLTALLKQSKLSLLTSTLVRTFFALGYLLSFGYCINGLHSGSLTYGTMTLFLSLFAQIQQPLMGLSHLVPQVISMLASVGRIMEIEAIPEDAATGADSLPKEVSLIFRDVSFAYDQEPVLQNVSFTGHPGQIIGVMGPSGAGKTTLIRLVLSLMPPASGQISLAYDGMEEPLSASSRRLIAYVPQGNTLLSGTIRDNLLWGNPNADEDELLRALSNADADFVHQLPEGLDTQIGEKAFGLSEGQAQRIAIARALLRRTPVLILDEATSALDEDSERRILAALADPQRTYAPLCLIITHRRTMRPYFDQLLEVQEDGTIHIA